MRRYLDHKKLPKRPFWADIWKTWGCVFFGGDDGIQLMQLLVNCWFGFVVWIPGIPLWKGLLRRGNPAIFQGGPFLAFFGWFTQIFSPLKISECLLKKDHFKRTWIIQASIFRGYVSLAGGVLGFAFAADIFYLIPVIVSSPCYRMIISFLSI